MTDIFYDTEFIERGPGHGIDLLSIGMVCGPHADYYAVTDDLALIEQAARNPWLRANVVKHLPVEVVAQERSPGGRVVCRWDRSHPDWDAVRPRSRIAADVAEFVLSRPAPKLWADYGAYDHVVLAQLFGTMIDLPDGMPMWTHDLQSELELYGVTDPPSLPGARGHNALDDAKEVQFRHGWLRSNRQPQLRIDLDVSGFEASWQDTMTRLVRMAHPGWTSDQVAAEVARIRAEIDHQ